MSRKLTIFTYEMMKFIIWNGGTSSEFIADICELSSIHDHFIIFTDGCVNIGLINESYRKMWLFISSKVDCALYLRRRQNDT